MTRRPTVWVFLEGHSEYLKIWHKQPKDRATSMWPDYFICKRVAKRFGFPMPTDKPIEVTVTTRAIRPRRKTTRATVPKEKAR